MKRYVVSVTRISYGFRDIEVEAKSRSEAKSKALEEAMHLLFEADDFDYKVDSINEKK